MGSGRGGIGVWGSGGVGGPVLEEHFPSSGPDGLVGLLYELGWEFSFWVGGERVGQGGGVCGPPAGVG